MLLEPRTRKENGKRRWHLENGFLINPLDTDKYKDRSLLGLFCSSSIAPRHNTIWPFSHMWQEAVQEKGFPKILQSWLPPVSSCYFSLFLKLFHPLCFSLILSKFQWCLFLLILCWLQFPILITIKAVAIPSKFLLHLFRVRKRLNPSMIVSLTFVQSAWNFTSKFQ